MIELQKQLSAWNAQTEYCAEYEHDGGRWALNFFAIDDEDAKKKIESIKQSLNFCGRLEMTVSV